MPADKRNLVGKQMPTRKQFMALFPLRDIVKYYVLFALYLFVSSVVFFSTEECLREKPHIPENQEEKRTGNCTVVSAQKGGGKNTHDLESLKINGTRQKDETVIIPVCGTVEKKDEEKQQMRMSKCRIKFSHVMRWIYFSVVHLHGADTASFHVTSKWGRIITGPVLVIGMILSMRLYAMLGFVLVNCVNFGVRKLRQRLKKFKATVKNDILVISTLLLVIYILMCAAVSKYYSAEKTTYGDIVFRWIMMLLTISDENLIEDPVQTDGAVWLSLGSTPQTGHTIVLVVLILLGFPIAVTFFAAVVNTMYRLTYNLNEQTRPKKGALQGWWV